MNYIIYYVLAVIVGYLCGNFISGYVIAKAKGIDIRNYGSGNAGSTNVLRVLGTKYAILTFIGDTMKAFIPMMLVKYLLIPALPGINGDLFLLILGLAAVLGHDYPFVLQFKGGKGVATTGAVMMAYDWKMGCLCILIFAIIVAITRYVSLGSCIIIGLTPFEMLIFHWGKWDCFVMAIVFAFFVIYRHRANIKRLIAGTESKIGQKVKVE